MEFISTHTSDLPQEEIEKVAEGLKVTVLDETVPYPSEEEIQTEIEEKEMAGRNGSAGGKYDSGRRRAFNR